MTMDSPRAVRELLARYGLRAIKSRGQHFLADPRVPGAIVEGADLTRTHGVLEIGPGLGALTRALSRAAGRVVAVEADRLLLPVLDETLRGLDNVTVLHGDILKTDLHALVREHFNGLMPVVCANLPYNITTPVLICLLDAGLFETITVMVQREVARRLRAEAGTPEYGAFTVFVGARASCKILFDVPPSCFIPAPRVTSSVVKLTRDAFPLYNPELFSRVVRAAFGQRRKTLPNALAGLFNLSKAELAAILRSQGLSPLTRGETLDIAAFDQLTVALEAQANFYEM